MCGCRGLNRPGPGGKQSVEFRGGQWEKSLLDYGLLPFLTDCKFDEFGHRWRGRGLRCFVDVKIKRTTQWIAAVSGCLKVWLYVGLFLCIREGHRSDGRNTVSDTAKSYRIAILLDTDDDR